MKNEKESEKSISQNKNIVPNDKSHKIIFQHNKLIEAHYNLTLQEKRILVWSLSKITPKDSELTPISISIQDFCSVIGISESSAYSEIKKITMRLRNRGMTITNLDQKTQTQVGWLDYVKYREKEGIVEIQFHRFLSSFLLELKSNFTAIPMSQTLGLSSIYAIRIFELLKQYEKIGEREISLSDLRSFCGVSDNKLKDYNDIKTKVLKIAQRELEAKTDIVFSFEEIKKSRKVVSINFIIQTNLNFKKKETEEKKKLKRVIEESKLGIQKKLLELGFSKSTTYKFFDQNEESQISKSLSVVLDQIEKGQALNPKALFRSALKGKWSTEIYTSKKKKNDSC